MQGFNISRYLNTKGLRKGTLGPSKAAFASGFAEATRGYAFRGLGYAATAAVPLPLAPSFNWKKDANKSTLPPTNVAPVGGYLEDQVLGWTPFQVPC